MLRPAKQAKRARNSQRAFDLIINIERHPYMFIVGVRFVKRGMECICGVEVIIERNIMLLMKQSRSKYPKHSGHGIFHVP